RGRKNMELKNIFINLPNYIISEIIIFIPVFYLDNKQRTNVITLAIKILLGIILYVVMIFILKPTILVKAKQMIEQRRKRSEEHTSELQSRFELVCRLLLENKNMI